MKIDKDIEKARREVMVARNAAYSRQQLGGGGSPHANPEDLSREAFQRHVYADGVMKTPQGFELINTGGNCTAWEFKLVGKCYALITQAGNPEAPTKTFERCVVSIYGEEDRQLVSMEFPCLQPAIKAVKCISFVEEMEV